MSHSSRVLGSIGLVLGAFGCGAPSEGVEFGVDEAPLDSPFSPGEQALDLQHRQDAVREFFAQRLARLDIQETTITDGGDIIDWVPFEPPLVEPPPSPPLEFVNGEEPATTELMDQPWARGPDGTVPHRRFDVEAYLERVGDNVPDDPASALRNKPAPSADPTTHRYYASYQLSGTSSGTEYWTGTSYLNIWNAADVYSGETNIAQIAMDRGTGLGHQTVETGKVEFDDGTPRFFTYFTTRNYDGPADDWVQGYDDDVLGFHQQSSVVFPGTAFTPGQISVLGGTQRTWAVEIQHNSAPYNLWWVWAQGEWVGYYVDCHNATSEVACTAPGATHLFASSGMRPSASRFLTYGEVFDAYYPNATGTDMGSGALASSGQGYAAYIRSAKITYSGDQSNPVLLQSATGTVGSGATDSACYSMSTIATGGSDGNKFFYGGPGRTSGGGGTTCP